MATIKSIEEKAKAYDEAIKVANKYKDTHIMFPSIKEEMFPELKESEGEKIREGLIEYFLHYPDHEITYYSLKSDSVIAWLEKQDSESKWCHHKVDLSECSEEYRKAYYDGWNNCNMQHSQCKSELDDVVKCLINGMKFYYEDNKDATWGTNKWSMPVKHIIEVLEQQGDQKPNPVLDIEIPFGSKDSELQEASYYIPEGFHAEIEGNRVVIKRGEQKPELKFDIPEIKIKDDVSVTSRVEYISEELKPIADFVTNYSHWNLHKDEWNHPVPEVPLFIVLDALIQEGKPYQGCVSCVEQKPAWSEEDKEKINSICNIIADKMFVQKQAYKSYYKNLINFLKSLKDRVQPKQEWSEEEKARIDRIIDVLDWAEDKGRISYSDWEDYVTYVRCLRPQPNTKWYKLDDIIQKKIINYFECQREIEPTIKDILNTWINWLKSLRPQSHWKPSDEQMEALKNCCNGWSDNGDGILDSLYEQLKKL